MASWPILKTLDLKFDEMGKENLDKIVAGMTTEDVKEVLADLEKARAEIKEWNQNLELAFSIVKTALSLATLV